MKSDSLELIDSHAHLQFAAYAKDREEVIARCQEKRLGVICVGTDFETSRDAVALAEKNENIWATVGFHPGHALPDLSWDDSDEGTKAATREPFNGKKFEGLVKHPRVAAIGETGLDYFRMTNDKRPETSRKQKEVFAMQIELAKKLKKPLVIHCRPSAGTEDAYEDIWDILAREQTSLISPPGVIHFFVGNIAIAGKFLDLGFYIAFSGVITFAKEYEEVVKFVPLDRILVETDAPYAAPVPYRGKRNEPSYVVEVAKKIADLKSVSWEEISAIITASARELFRI